MKRKIMALISMILAFCMVFTFMPTTVLAEDNTMTFSEFVDALDEGKGTFDGEGVTVRWEPDETKDVIHRVQEPNAQYQLLSGEEYDINISNVNFEYVPKDIPGHSDGWSGIDRDWTKDQIRNAEFQFLNKGDVTITNCTFEKIIVSPFGPGDDTAANAERKTTVTGCSFSNVYNAYALKDIYTSDAVIKENVFDNCSGGIYFEGSVPRGMIKIEENKFDDIDKYAAQGKENTRGIIQFSSKCILNESTRLTVSGNTITGNLVKDTVIIDDDTGIPVIREIASLGEITVGGWTPGEAFSIKLDGSNLTLPDMPSGIVDDIQYDFIGWANANIYAGVTDITDKEQFLKAGDTGENGEFYYAVWKATPQQNTGGTSAEDQETTAAGTTDRQENTSGTAQTSDTFEVITWTVLMLAAGVAALSIIMRSRKSENK